LFLGGHPPNGGYRANPGSCYPRRHTPTPAVTGI
jgi:hypothetical protein